MRKIISLVLLLNLVLAPVASGVALAMGGTGEHLHFDRSWESIAEAVDITSRVQDDHTRGLHIGHGHDHHDAGSGALKHTHCDQAHLATFVLPLAVTWVVPQSPRDLRPGEARLPFARKSYPPFRPPQVA